MKKTFDPTRWLLKYTLVLLFKKYVFKKDFFSRREAIANLYIRRRKKGIEIGAAQYPLKLSNAVEVKYVDKQSKEEFKKTLETLGMRDGIDKGCFVDVDAIGTNRLDSEPREPPVIR